MGILKSLFKFSQKGGKNRSTTKIDAASKPTEKLKINSSTDPAQDREQNTENEKDQLRERRKEELMEVASWHRKTRKRLLTIGIIILVFAVFLFDLDVRNFSTASNFRELFQHPVFTRTLIILSGISMILLSFVPLRKVYQIVRQDIDRELEKLTIEDYFEETPALTSTGLTEEKEELKRREYFLKSRRKEIRKYARWHRWLRRILIALGAFSLLFSIFVFDLAINNGPFASPGGLFQNPRITRILIILFGLFMLLISMVPVRNAFQIERQAIDHELEMIRIGVYSIEARAETLFKQHHLELKRYYDEALSENSWLYKIGVVCLTLGFVIIGITFYFFYTQKFDVESEIIIAILGGVSAIATDFVAAVYIKMHSETIKTLTQFHNRFVNTHHFYFGNFLISKIKNEDKRDAAIVKLALSIIDDIESEEKTEPPSDSSAEEDKKKVKGNEKEAEKEQEKNKT
ncbi:hypothetical protein ACSFXN_01010 [Planococcus sp. 1R117A]|uniref:hypothetical protein n=1 Tax=Planococcus sp. 1R117A TaxID=3447020 RepID=UPI003EDCA740